VNVLRGAAALALAFGLAWPALAQSRGNPGDFDFYVLALSWSPGWCAVTGDSRDSGQCRDGSGQGFVLHGLWPQYDRGFPSSCGAFSRSVPRDALETARGLYPSEGLARHEWQKHGTCSGLDPRGYFRAAAQAVSRVTVPGDLAEPREDVRTTPIEIERAFAAANPGLRPDSMAVACSRGLLQEVRICLSRDLRNFVSCPEVDRRACRGGVTVPAVR